MKRYFSAFWWTIWIALVALSGRSMGTSGDRSTAEFLPKPLIDANLYSDRTRRKGTGLEVAMAKTMEAMTECFRATRPQHHWNIELTEGEIARESAKLESCLREAASAIPRRIAEKFYPDRKISVCR